MGLAEKKKYLLETILIAQLLLPALNSCLVHIVVIFSTMGQAALGLQPSIAAVC